MDLSFVVTNEINQPHATITARQPPTKSGNPSLAVGLIALISDFIAHQPPPLFCTPDPSSVFNSPLVQAPCPPLGIHPAKIESPISAPSQGTPGGSHPSVPVLRPLPLRTSMLTLAHLPAHGRQVACNLSPPILVYRRGMRPNCPKLAKTHSQPATGRLIPVSRHQRSGDRRKLWGQSPLNLE